MLQRCPSFSSTSAALASQLCERLISACFSLSVLAVVAHVRASSAYRRYSSAFDMLLPSGVDSLDWGFDLEGGGDECSLRAALVRPPVLAAILDRCARHQLSGRRLSSRENLWAEWGLLQPPRPPEAPLPNPTSSPDAHDT